MPLFAKGNCGAVACEIYEGLDPAARAASAPLDIARHIDEVIRVVLGRPQADQVVLAEEPVEANQEGRDVRGDKTLVGQAGLRSRHQRRLLPMGIGKIANCGYWR